MSVTLQPITRKTWYECTQLAVTEAQRQIFPIPVVYWMAKSKYEDEIDILAIYHQEQMVGMVAYALDPDDREYWIYAIMIDQKYQGQGYGKCAVQEVVKRLQHHYQCQRIKIGYRPDNLIADTLYASLGFKKTGEMIDGEIISVLKCLSY